MAKRMLVIAGIITLVLVMASLALTDVPQLISFQGKLYDNADNPLTGQYEITFRIYDVEEGGAPLWSETDSVECENGLYNVILGLNTPLNHDFDGNYWLGVQVTGDVELSPRFRIVSVPTAFRAAVADSAAMAASAVNSDKLDGKHFDAFADSAHLHDERYYTQDSLNTSDGDAPNVGSNMVHWDNLWGLPAGFADGTDDVGAAGGVSQINAGAGIEVTNPTGPTATVAHAADASALPGAHHTKTTDASELTSGVLDNARLNMGHGGGIDADMVDGLHADALADTGHTHHDLYYTETELNTSDGDAPNVGSNLVHWDNLNGVPGGFADGVDDTGGVTDHGELTGLEDDDHPQYALDTDLAAHAADASAHHTKTTDASELTSGVLDTARFSAYSDLEGEGKIGTGADQVAAGDHNHDAVYVNEGQANSITSAMIVDSTIQQVDLAFTPGDRYSLDAADGDPIDAVYVDSLGNVGIGTTKPGAKLEVAGEILSRSSNPLVNWVDTGVSPNPGWAVNIFEGDLTFWYTADHDNPSWSTKVTLESTGNVGIGTTTPDQKLDVEGTAQMTGFKLPTDATSGYVLTSDASGVGTWKPAAGGIGGSGTANYVSKFIDTTTLGNSVIYDDAGNVGIGTTSPMSKFHVIGDVIAEGGDFALRDSHHRYRLQYGGSGIFNIRQVYDADNTLLNVIRLSIANNGNVGIGTTTPTTRLDIAGECISDVDVIYGTGDKLSLASYDRGGNTNSYISFHTADGSSTGERVRIDSSGNVGIGTTDPSTKLHIEGGIDAGLTTHGFLVLGPVTGQNIVIDQNEIIARDNGATSPLYIQHNGGNTLLNRDGGNVGIGDLNPTYRLELPNNASEAGRARANQWVTYSSREEKRNITALEPEDYAAVLKEIQEMDLVYYRYKKQKDQRRYLGVIAEEAPEQVVTSDRKGLSLSEFAAFAMAGLKAQQAEIEQLKREIQNLRSQVSE